MHKKISLWNLIELFLGSFILAYFLGYNRDTLSDFIVCTIASLAIYFGANKLGLQKPVVKNNKKFDRILLLITISIFCAAWIYGFVYNKTSLATALTSVAITFTYFYYATIQHFLAQRYLALRMLNIAHQNIYLASLMTGIIFGGLHIPYPHLIAPSALGGFLYAYYYLNTGKLWAVISSHALIASTILYWVLDDNPFTELIALLKLM